MPYRESPEFLERERERLIGEIRELEARWTDVFWQEVAPDHKLTRLASDPRSADVEGDLVRLTRHLKTTEAIEVRHEAIVEAWSRFHPPAKGEQSIDLENVDQATFIGHTTNHAYNHTKSVRRVAKHVQREAAILEVDMDVRVSPGIALHLEIVAGAPCALKAFQVRPEGVMDELRRAFGRSDVEIGVPDFDGVFSVQGDERSARAVLTPEACASLLTLGEFGGVDLSIGAGLVSWRGVAMHNDTDVALAMRAVLHVIACAQRAPLPALRADQS